MTTVSLRSCLRPLVAVILLATVAGCTDTPDPQPQTASTLIPPARTVLRVAAEEWPSCLNPLLCASTPLREQVLQQVLPVAFEIDAANQYRPSPALADEPTVAPADDGSFTITYRLADGARWADDRPITSSDIAGTWQAIMSTPGADTRGYRLISAIDDADPRTAIVTMSAPWAGWRDLFGGASGWILQADSFGATTDLTGRFIDSLPFSAGPFQLGAWDRDVAILTKNSKYWATDRLAGVDQMRIERVAMDDLGEGLTYDVVIPGDDTRIDPPADFVAAPAPTSAVLGVWFDQRDLSLIDPTNRASLNAVIDPDALRESAAELQAGIDAVDCLGWLPASGEWCAIGAVDRPAPNPDLAAFALAGVGWQRDAAGQLARGGLPFVVTVANDFDDVLTSKVADDLVAQLQTFGLAVNRVDMSTSTWRSARSAATSSGIGVYAVDVGRGPDVSGLYGCAEGPDSSVLAWCPADVVAQTAELAAASDPDEQARLVAAIGRRVAAEGVWIPIGTRPTSALVKPERVASTGDATITGGTLAQAWKFTVAN